MRPHAGTHPCLVKVDRVCTVPLFLSSLHARRRSCFFPADKHHTLHGGHGKHGLWGMGSTLVLQNKRRWVQGRGAPRPGGGKA